MEKLSESDYTGKRILLVEDNELNREIAGEILQMTGAKVETAENGKIAVEKVEASPEGLYDLVFMDIQMPAMNGFDLLRLLRASNIPQAKTIPVIAVTARSDMKREEFLQHGFAGSLHKPFTVNELLAEIGVLQADIATVDAAPSSTLNFSALTAFSGDDPDAAKSILESFVTETRLNVDRLRQALETEDTDGIAAMGHKMLPLFTLLGANDLVTLLKELEASRGVPFDEKIKEKSLAALNLIEDILEQAFLFISSA